MASLQVTSNHDYRPDTLGSITEVAFLGSYRATFAQSQFGGTGISNALTITGAPPKEDRAVLEVFLTEGLGPFSASLWSVEAPFKGTEIRFFGTDGDDSITGILNTFLQARIEIVGAGGADTLLGGNGDDTFIYAAAGDAAPGETIDGGASGVDTDTISVRADNDFRETEIANIEWVEILGDGTTATFHNFDLYITFDDYFVVRGDEAKKTEQTLVVEIGPENYVSLRNIFFFDWKSEDRIFVNGGPSADNLFGSYYKDIIDGRQGTDDLEGYEGKDWLDGGAGRDLLDGGLGKDTLTGGAEDDVFIFRKPLMQGRNLDHITDFEGGVDVIRLNKTVFKGLGRDLPGNAFHAGANAAKAEDEKDRIIYDTATGALYFDHNGKGGAKAVQFTVLDGAPELAAGDFTLSG